MTSPTSEHSEGQAPQDPFLAELPWLRRLAMRLTGNDQDADDLTQQAWLDAAQAREPLGSPRSWLARIARNAQRATRRAERRRRRREAALPQGNTAEPTDEICARLDAHRELLTTVKALPEPYRSTVTERFLYERSVQEIAALHGVPRQTVTSRLRRGLDQLRGRLDREMGSRGAWLALLGPAPVAPLPVPTPAATQAAAPAAPPTGATTVAAVAALLVSTKILLTTAGLTGVVLLALIAWPTGLDSPNTGPAPSLVAETHDAHGPGGMTPLADPREIPSRSKSAPAPDPTVNTQSFSEDQTAARFPLLCLDPEGRPVEGVRFLVSSNGNDGNLVRRIGPSDASGRIHDLQVWSENLILDPAHPDNGPWQLVVRPRAFAPDPVDDVWVAVVAPVVTLTGWLTSSSGEALGDPRIELGGPEDWQAKLPRAIHRGYRLAQGDSLQLDAGHFELRMPAIPGQHLEFSAAGHQGKRVPLPMTDRDDLRVELTAIQSRWRLSGVVLQGNGKPLPGAVVTLAESAVRTGGDGRFCLHAKGDAPPTEVWAVAPGMQPNRARVRGPANGREITGLQIVLEQPSLAISGTVQDSNGDPIPFAHVWCIDPMKLGSWGAVDVVAESIAGQVNRTSYSVQADRNGRFRMAGLLARIYRVQAASPESALLMATTREIAAGNTGVELMIDERLGRKPVRGLVTDLQGNPLPGALLSVRHNSRGRDTTGRPLLPRVLGAKMIRSDPDGRFVFENLPLDADLTLACDRDGHWHTDVILPAGQTAPEYRLALPRAVEIIIDLDQPSRGDAVSFQAAEGEDVFVRMLTTRGLLRTRVPLHEGKARVKAPETLTQAVLWSDGIKAAVVPLGPLAAGALTLRF